MTTIKKITANIIGTGLLALLAANTAQAQIGCDRACLTGYVDMWFKGLTSNTTTGVPLAENVKISANGQLTDLKGTFWDSADTVPYRWDIANIRLGDTGTEAVLKNADGTLTMLIVRLKVTNGAITEIETVKTNQGESDRLWGPEMLLAKPLSPALTLSIPEAERDSYYRLIAAAESYWRAFQTNGTPAYHPADLMSDTSRFENGLQTTGMVRDGNFVTAASGFNAGRFIGRNLWDRRYPVVDEERGIVLSMVRFGLKDGMESQSVATSNSRVVGEFFAVQQGLIREVHAVLFNVPDSAPAVWDGAVYSPPRGGAGW
ncbi:MAG: hypothetical protein V4603_00930 [Pseudomonadota bacterium]